MIRYQGGIWRVMGSSMWMITLVNKLQYMETRSRDKGSSSRSQDTRDTF